MFITYYIPTQLPEVNKLVRLALSSSRCILLSRMPGYGSYSDSNSQHMFPGYSRNRSYIPNYGFVNSEPGRSDPRYQHNTSRDSRYTQRHYHTNTTRNSYDYGEEDRRYPYRDQVDPYSDRNYTSRYHQSRSDMERRNSRSPTRRTYPNDAPNNHNRSSSPRRPPTGPKAYREHDNTPVPPPPPQKPSDEYIAIASQSPSRVPESSDLTRKLLIMDLNGTLLHRSAPPINRQKRKEFPPVDDRPRDANGRPLPRIRPVHPRPYMPAFRNYLFASDTKKWLDSMIWSSAQPHSVNDMVQKTFGDSQDQLLTIWARDTLGLTDEHYTRKVQTFKDLTKPWTELPDALSAKSKPQRVPSRGSSPYASPLLSSSQQLPPSSPPSSSPTEERSVHSALTTLLLDDSPRKAERQPYNHVCLPEYDGSRRAKDLELLELERARQSVAEEEKETTEHTEADTSLEPVESATEDHDLPESTEDNEGEAVSTKRKRKSKKNKRREALLADRRDPYSLEDGYDPMLLAVVGALDEIKRQANVAAWIHSGGLWGPPELKLREHTSEPSLGETQGTENNAVSSATVAAEVSDGDGSDLSVDMDGGQKEKSRKQRVGQDKVGQKPDTELSGYVGEGTGANQELTDETASVTPIPPTMWFEHASTFLYWAKRGRGVLEQMGIPIEHG
ncbi:hypothetical protein QCA50_001069 [Cerrena zonata]|uniref:FCP1 homology domain-containing protein n=1 Tax=Cerrena zonata TaxID=2478898 RepID=A0AAW0GUG7_9APHY